MPVSHTKGPWKSVTYDTHIVETDNEHFVVADVNNVKDVRLIAAAPEMYDELKAGVELVKKAHRRQDCYCELCMWSGRAEELLAKAEGRDG